MATIMVNPEIFFVITLLVVISAITVNSEAPAPAVDCTDELVKLADCLSFVQQGSKLAKPQGTCCSGLKKVVKEKVSCLCEAFNTSSNFGVDLNMTKALTLPTACGVSTPPFSKCKISVAGAPVEAPAPSPAGSATQISGGRGPVAPTPSPFPNQSNAAAVLGQSFGFMINAIALAMYLISMRV